MPTIDLLLFFLTRELDRAGIDDDDVIAGIDERRIAGLVFALQEPRGGRRNASENLTVGVNDVPAAAGGRAVGAGHERRHAKLNLSILLEPAHA